MKIEELGLTDRTRRALQRNAVHTVEQLLELTPADLFAMRGIGKIGFQDISDRLRELEKKKTPGR